MKEAGRISSAFHWSRIENVRTWEICCMQQSSAQEECLCFQPSGDVCQLWSHALCHTSALSCGKLIQIQTPGVDGCSVTRPIQIHSRHPPPHPHPAPDTVLCCDEIPDISKWHIFDIDLIQIWYFCLRLLQADFQNLILAHSWFWYFYLLGSIK